ncbi:MAG: helix-turn-helix transcriptional regulator [Chloroflexi bacterium]|nr:helix-turn-helix transcriptional regulator [Chloroflexota bacterium]
MDDLGVRIRALRLRKGMTIPGLSQLSGLSPGFLSQIETGKASLSLDSLARIADALGLCPGDLFAAPPPAPRVVRAHRRPRLRWGDGPEAEYLAPLLEARAAQAALLRLAPGGRAGGCDHAHAGEELVWVLAGHVRVLQGEHTEELVEGDSALLDGRLPHTYEAMGADEARLLVISAPPAEVPLKP